MRQTRRATADPAPAPATAPGTTASATVIAVECPVIATVADTSIAGTDGRTT